MLARRQSVAAASDLLAQLEGRKPGAGATAGRGGTRPTGSPFLEGQTLTVAGAALLQRVADAVTKVGGNVLSSQVDVQGVQAKDGYRQRDRELRSGSGRDAAAALRPRSRHAVPVRRAVRRAGGAGRHRPPDAGGGCACCSPSPAAGGATNERAPRAIFALAAALLLGAIDARGANPPVTLDLPPSNVIPAPVEIVPGAPSAADSARPRQASRAAIRSGRFRSPR